MGRTWTDAIAPPLRSPKPGRGVPPGAGGPPVRDTRDARNWHARRASQAAAPQPSRSDCESGTDSQSSPSLFFGAGFLAFFAAALSMCGGFCGGLAGAKNSM